LVDLRNKFEVEYRNKHLEHILEHLRFLVENKNPFVNESLNDLHHSHFLNVYWISDSHVKDDRFKYLFRGLGFKFFILAWGNEALGKTSSLLVHQL